ncbi:MAG: hypothetical protein RLZZ630_1603, partial [Bacteroidota bacterium]
MQRRSELVDSITGIGFPKVLLKQFNFAFEKEFGALFKRTGEVGYEELMSSCFAFVQESFFDQAFFNMVGNDACRIK